LAAHLGENAVVMRINFKDQARRWLQMAEKFAIRGPVKYDSISRNFRISNCFQRLDLIPPPL
jgi:hypothetical protein